MRYVDVTKTQQQKVSLFCLDLFICMS